MPVTRSAFRVVVLLALARPACLPYGQPEPSSVAQGRYFATGEPDYDEFFVQLYRLQVDLQNTPDALAAERARLATALGLPPDTDATRFRGKLVDHVNALRARGVRFQYARENQNAVLRVSGTSAGGDAEFGGTLAGAVETVTTARRKSPGWHERLHGLPARGVTLENGIEAAFVGHSRGTRSDVRRNLTDAQQLLVLMAPRLTRIDEQTTELYDALEAALREAPPPPPPEPEPEAKPKANGAKPKPRAPKPDDGEAAPPPPPPKQGTAKPDFEP